MPGPPQLTPFNVKEQRFYYKLPSDDGAPRPISKHYPGHFSHLYIQGPVLLIRIHTL